MTSPCEDPASEIVTVIIDAVKAAFDPESDCPPVGGGSTSVRFYAGEGAPIEEVNCAGPLLWVRLASRYRSQDFPEPSVVASPCGDIGVLEVEVGVARCALTGEGTTPAQYAAEAEVSLDDSWRLGKVLCLVSGLLEGAHSVGSDMISPYGPEGGIIAWATTLYVSI